MSYTPRFIFIAPAKQDRSSSLVEAWRAALKELVDREDRIDIEIQEGRLQEIDPKLLQCDCMVSPANSFGIMDGG